MPFALSGHTDRSARGVYAIGRLASGVSLQQAQTEMDGIALRLKPLFPPRPNLIPGAFDGATLMDLRQNLTRASRNVLWLVFGAVAAVFLIACVNVVGLLLAYAEDRKRELAVRAAIGADRTTLVRQLLVEAALLAIVGASAGWVFSLAVFRVIVNQIPQWLQLLGEPQLDGRAVAFAGFLALLTLVIAGVIPAVRASGEGPERRWARGSARPAVRSAAGMLSSSWKLHWRHFSSVQDRSCCAAG